MATHTFSQSNPAYLKHYDVIGADNVARRAAVDGCNALLRAQLRAGMHILDFDLAKSLGRKLGMSPGSVRPGTSYPTEGSR